MKKIVLCIVTAFGPMLAMEKRSSRLHTKKTDSIILAGMRPEDTRRASTFGIGDIRPTSLAIAA